MNFLETISVQVPVRDISQILPVKWIYPRRMYQIRFTNFCIQLYMCTETYQNHSLYIMSNNCSYINHGGHETFICHTYSHEDIVLCKTVERVGRDRVNLCVIRHFSGNEKRLKASGTPSLRNIQRYD